jgi:SAM-dependent methyltransferase
MKKQLKPTYAKGCIGVDPDYKFNVSPTLLKFAERISSVQSFPVLDVPCGYGRHSFFLASIGCNVICIDINRDALNFVSACQKKHGFQKEQLLTQECDLIRDPWAFQKNTVGAIINVHYYQESLLENFIYSIVPGGYLYLETPGNHGQNFIDLPKRGIVRQILEPYFEILYYKEKSAGPSDSNSVTVKVLAQKRSRI